MAAFLDRIGRIALLSCAAVLLGRSAGAQFTPELFEYPRTLLSGIVSAEVNVSESACREICISRSGCTGLDHSSDEGLCRIFASVGGAMESSVHTAATRMLITGYHPPANRPAEPPPEPEPPAQEFEEALPPAAVTFRQFRNRDLTRSATKTSSAQTVDQCETMCRSEGFWCRAYTFDDWNSKCYLKSGSGELLLNARATTGVGTELGIPPSSGAPVDWKMFNNKAFPGNGFTVLEARDRDSCAGECWILNQCIAFSYTAAQDRCVLHQYPKEYETRRGTFSGAKQQD